MAAIGVLTPVKMEWTTTVEIAVVASLFSLFFHTYYFA